MKSLKKTYWHIVIVFLFSCCIHSVSAQQKVTQYTKDFEFKDGVYLSFLDFKNNHPIPASKILFDSNKDDRDYLKIVMNNPILKYTNESGTPQEIRVDGLWGYCSNGTIYIQYGVDFNRMTIIGSMSHFIATIKIRISSPNPFGYNDPFYNNQQFTYITQQCMLDFESGTILDFNVENLESILIKDDTLYKEFELLKRRKKRDLIFFYLRKYNERHPVYFVE